MIARETTPDLGGLIVTSLLAIFLSLWATRGVLWAKPEKGFELFFASPQLQIEGFKRTIDGQTSSNTRNINRRMNELNKSIIIFWGSQSGNAERLAKSLVRDCTTRFRLPAMAADLEHFDFDQLGNLSDGRLVGFVLSTYGEGGPPDNAVGLYDYLRTLREEGRNQSLSRLRYFCFGLGSSKYQFYNRFVDVLDEVLASSGAQRIAPVGKIDEVDHSDDDWLRWKDSMGKELAQRFGMREVDIKQQPAYELVSRGDALSYTEAVRHVAETSTNPGLDRQLQLLRVGRSVQLSRSHTEVDGLERKYLHVDLSAAGSQRVRYQTGDHVAIWPINPNDEVARLASLFGWDDKTLKEIVDIRPRMSSRDNTACPLPTPTTRESLLKYQLDICGPVNAEMLDLLAFYSPNDDGKEFLNRCRHDSRTRVEISGLLLTCGQLMQRAAPGMKWDEDIFLGLLQIMPTLRPRYYSISSSPLDDPDSLSITVGMVERRIPQRGQLFVGLATGYIDQLHRETNQMSPDDAPRSPYNLDGPHSEPRGCNLYAHIKPTGFKLPADAQRPVLMIAAGSGIAPFRAFVQERQSLARQGRSVGTMMLLYGCRSEHDFPYSGFWSEPRTQALLETHVAYSRQRMSGKNVYVQHELLEHAEAVTRLVHENDGYVYICGGTAMASAVRSVLATLLGGSRAIERLKELGRLQQDVWG